MSSESQPAGKRPAKGEKLAPLSERLARIGLVESWDYVLHLPLRYEDETKITPIALLEPGEPALVEAMVDGVQKTGWGSRSQLLANVHDDTGRLELRYLHFYPSLEKMLVRGKLIRFFGEARPGRGGPLVMFHPKMKFNAGGTLSQALTPVYPAGENIQQTWLRKRIDRAMLDLDLSDPVPVHFTEPLGLPGFRQSLEYIHHPPPDADTAGLQERTSPYWRRLIFDELLAQQILLRTSRETMMSQQAPVIGTDGAALCDAFLKALPFKLTGAQERVIAEIRSDLKLTRPMHRLVQGDVGSGKTVVAAMAALTAIDAGFQVALMAPTEILAEQHFSKLKAWLEPLGVTVLWLAGKMKARERAEALEAISAGSAGFVIGTHALIQEGVRFAHLGLAIIDEQHRFGVEQRLALRSANDAGLSAHLLMLSATPIPRTLAMSYLADLDVSVIDELPPGRTPIITKLVRASRKEEVFTALSHAIASGAQAYWVCPLVEESDALDLTPATLRYEELARALPECRIGLVHGQMPGEQKDQVMSEFAAGRIDILVATTVIEVGVDVPNASLMVIEHAERFGLSQLHQLRGRVGRGAKASSCVLLFGEELSETAKERLKIIRESTDGFEIARRDLQLRGPGEFLGERQSGMPFLRFADLERDELLLRAAADVAGKWLAQDKESALRHAAHWFVNQSRLLSA